MRLTRRRFLGTVGTAIAATWAGCGDDGNGAGDAAAGDAGLAGDAARRDAAFSGDGAPGAAPDATPRDASPPATLTGRVLRPGHPEWDAARTNANTRFSIEPQVIVFAASVDDVVHAIAWARENRVPLRARSGRHSYEAYSLVEGGLVLDVSEMRGVEVDRARGRATIGAGANLGTVYERLFDEGVTIPAGSCVSVGIAGLVLGGGVGLLARKHGLTCDRLVGADLVDAEGRVLHASAGENPDLFWALRGGGGGNFGVVTAFELATSPAADVATYDASWPIAAAAELLAAWQSFAPAADPGLMSVLTVGMNRVTSVGQYAGTASELEALLAPLTGVATPTSLQIRSRTTIEAVRAFGGDYDTRSKFKKGSTYARTPFSGAAITALLDAVAGAPGPSNAIQLDALRGQIAAVAAADTAFVHRDALFSLQLHAAWTDGADEARNRAWIRSTRQALAPYTSGAYVNYIDGDLAGDPAAYYGANLSRLSSVKRRYDPDGFFSFPQAIPA